MVREKIEQKVSLCYFVRFTEIVTRETNDITILLFHEIFRRF